MDSLNIVPLVPFSNLQAVFPSCLAINIIRLVLFSSFRSSFSLLTSYKHRPYVSFFFLYKSIFPVVLPLTSSLSFSLIYKPLHVNLHDHRTSVFFPSFTSRYALRTCLKHRPSVSYSLIYKPHFPVDAPQSLSCLSTFLHSPAALFLIDLTEKVSLSFFAHSKAENFTLLVPCSVVHCLCSRRVLVC